MAADGQKVTGRRTVFRGGVVVGESSSVREDLLVEDGVVVARGRVPAADAVVVPCDGRVLMPGVVDAHVHLFLEVGGIRTADDVRSGSRAAVAGGVTTVADFVEASGEPLEAALTRHARAWEASACDWVAHLMVTPSLTGVLDGLASLAAAGAIRSVKAFTAYGERGLRLDDEVLVWLIEASARHGFVVIVHAEDEATIRVLVEREKGRSWDALALARTRPIEAEVEAISRVLRFARETNGRVHLAHLSCPEAAWLVAQERERGTWASAETCPHYLLFSEDVLGTKGGHRFATVPPLRPRACAEGMWECIHGGAVQVITTDSCAFSLAAKDTWGGEFTRIPCGIPGVEVSLRVMVGQAVHGGRLTLNDVVRLMSANPARLLGVYPRKGSLEVGSDADVVVLDPRAIAPVDTSALISRAGWSPYEGLIASAPPERVYLRGHVVAQGGRYVGEGVAGQPLARGEPTCPA